MHVTTKWRRNLIRLLAVYLAICGMLALFQRSLIYHPTKTAPLAPEQTGLPEGWIRTVTVEMSDGVAIHGWHLLSTTPTSRATVWGENDQPIVLYFPGNAGNRHHRLSDFRMLTELGVDVIAFDYRGYAENRGRPSESLLVSDAQAIWKDLCVAKGLDSSRLILFGESLGGGVAVALADHACRQSTRPRALILRATFSSLVDAAAHHFPLIPVRLLLVDRYNSVARIPNVDCPILHFHGDRDDIVPIGLGERLFAAAPSRSANGVEKSFVRIRDAGHNDLIHVARPTIVKTIREFLGSIPE